MNEPVTPTESTFVPETTPSAPAAPAAPAAPSDTTTVHGTIPAHLQGVTLKETFLPEDEGELSPGSAVAKTSEQLAEEKAKADEAAKGGKPSDGTQPTTTTKPADTIVQPKNSQNEEIVDKTKPKEDVLLAGKYKTVEELKHGIEELGGDHAGITDPKMLEQVYKVAQSTYTKMTQRQTKADELARKPEAPKGFQLTDELVKGMVDQLDFTKIDDAKMMADQMFRIMFSTFQKSLPEMLPKQAPAMDPIAMAAKVEQVNTATDSLGFIEAKVPRLTTDTNFRDQFAIHIKNGKEKGTYPATMGREDMVRAMKDFQKMLAEMAGATLPADTQDKGAAVVPDGGDALSTETTPNPDEDLLGSILEAKQKRDAKIV